MRLVKPTLRLSHNEGDPQLANLPAAAGAGPER